MKRCFTLLLCAVFCLAMCSAAFADIAIEPSGNSFYQQHFDQCSYENRLYFTNGSEGYVYIYDSPNSSSPKAAAKNGEIYCVLWVYKDWGCFDYDPETMEAWGDESGWVRLADMAADYDSDSFSAEHSSELEHDRALTLRIKTGETVPVWKYPGSGIQKTDIANYTNEPEAEVSFNTLYTDSQGRQWGQLGYFFGRVDGWVCVSDPLNTALEADENYRELDITEACSDEELRAALKEARAMNYTLIAGAAAAVLMAAAVLVYVIKRKKN